MHHYSVLIFAAITLAIVIVFIAFAKNLSRSCKAINKKTSWILFFITLLNAVVAFGASFLTDETINIFCFFSAIFLIFGVIHIVFTRDMFVADPAEKKYLVTTSEILFAFAICLFGALVTGLLVFYVKDNEFLLFPTMMSVFAFLVPLFFSYTYEAAVKIPSTDFIVWEYPVTTRIDPPEITNEDQLVIGFNVSKQINDKKTIFRAKAPESIILGELFYHFINEYNDEANGTPIVFLDDDENPIIWWFRLKRKWYKFNKVLNPHLRLKDNAIKENSVIVCEQIIPKATKK